MLSPCLECGTPCQGGRCATHRKASRHEHTTSRRGYGSAHQQARASLARQLPCLCAYGCGTWLTAESKWVAAHVVDGDTTAGYVVACAPCNERAKRTRRGQGGSFPRSST